MVISHKPIKPEIGQIQGVVVWPMLTYPDARGRLFKAYSSADQDSFPVPFITYEHFFTESHKYAFRGMHFQGNPHAVSKIISIVKGTALDFLFDMRANSETFGILQVINLDSTNPVSIFIPTGVAHGYLALEEKTIISYRMDGSFCGNCDAGFNGEIISSLLPIRISETIQSTRDLELIEFSKFSYSSKCYRAF